MSNLLDADSFGTYNGTGSGIGLAGKWTFGNLAGGGGSVSLVTGQHGTGQRMRFNAALSTAGYGGYRVFPAARSTGGVHISFMSNRFSTYNLWLLSGSTYMIGMLINADGSGYLGRATAANAVTSLAAFPAGTFVLNTEYQLEINFTIHDTTGSLELKIGGTQVAVATNVDTRNGTPTTVDRVQVGNHGGTGSGGNWYFGDYALYDGDCNGPRRVDYMPVAADTADEDLTPSTGTDSAAMIDEAPASTTDYIDGITVGDLSMFTMSSAVSTPSVVDGMMVAITAAKTDVTVRTVNICIAHGGNHVDSSAVTLSTTPQKFAYLVTSLPGGTPITPANYNAGTIGAKIAS